VPPELGDRELAIIIATSLASAALSIWLIVSSAFAEGMLKLLEAVAGVAGGFISIHILVAALATLRNERG